MIERSSAGKDAVARLSTAEPFETAPNDVAAPDSDQRERMLRGDWYTDDGPVLTQERDRCRRLLARFNDDGIQRDERVRVLRDLLGQCGEGSWIRPRFQCDYGYLIRLGSNCFVNYDAIFLDCAPITIGDDAWIGPRVQLLTPLHPVEDHEMRRQGWERAEPIVIGSNAWLGGGVIVCPGVTIGQNTVVGAGSVVTRDLPEGVLAVGNPARVIRELG